MDTEFLSTLVLVILGVFFGILALGLVTRDTSFISAIKREVTLEPGGFIRGGVEPTFLVNPGESGSLDFYGNGPGNPVPENLPCGIKIESPAVNANVSFPLTLSGWFNGCGWTGSNNPQVQIFSQDGTVVTNGYSLSRSGSIPIHFSKTITLSESVIDGSVGVIVITNDEGKIKSRNIRF